MKKEEILEKARKDDDEIEQLKEKNGSWYYLCF